jgi:hypothetical protein
LPTTDDPAFTCSPRERRLILRLRQLDRQRVDRVTLQLSGGWRIVEKIDDAPELLEDLPATVLTP